MKIVLNICAVLLFPAILSAVYQFFWRFRLQEMMKRAWEESIRVLDRKRQGRKKQEKRKTDLYGEMETKTIMAKIDGNLAYSGLSVRFPKLTAENFTAVFVLVLGAECLFVCLFGGTWITGSLATCVTGAAVWEGLHLLRAVRYRKISGVLLHFIDVLEVQALTCKDVIQLLGMAAEKVKEPLRSELLFTVTDARHCGSSSKAIRRLCSRIEHRYVKDLLLNLDICSRGKANYREVIRTAKKIVMQDLSNSTKLKMLYRNAFFFALSLSGIGFFCMNVMQKMTGMEGGVTSLWQGGGLGRFCIIYLVGVSLGGSWHFAKKMIR